MFIKMFIHYTIAETTENRRNLHNLIDIDILHVLLLFLRVFWYQNKFHLI